MAETARSLTTASLVELMMLADWQLLVLGRGTTITGQHCTLVKHSAWVAVPRWTFLWPLLASRHLGWPTSDPSYDLCKLAHWLCSFSTHFVRQLPAPR